eukprot:TRINITY_DN48414_c0_g1_i1.p1 TRINITY_DN48414_c0_g1~~TRINITY_DN48414_c0_g1_i1.p1  ORF type:complete len:715 (+),score=259.74 TRINITY_DN48414_c0_g1_i1:98-2242(+)
MKSAAVFATTAALLAQNAVAESPVNKVVVMLKDLKKEAEADKKAEADAIKKYNDWCKETKDQATEDIKDDKKTIDDATEKVNALAGTTAKTRQVISYAKKEIGENIERTDAATKIRNTERKAFLAAEKNFKNSVASLDAGLKSLGDSFLQKQSTATLKRVAHALLQMKKAESIDPSNLKLLQEFVTGPAAGYESATGQVEEIIKQTSADFKEDLKEITATEKDKQDAYDKLKKTLDDERDALEKTVKDETAANADNLKTYTDAKTLREQTEVELAATTKLLDDTTLACKVKNEEFEKRKELRTQELAGFDKALEILEKDDNKKIFEDSAKVMFLQVKSHTDSIGEANRQLAFKAIKEVATKYQTTELALVAVEVLNGGHFDKVIETIDKQIKNLRDEAKEDQDHKVMCKEQLAKQAADLVSLADTISKLGTKISRQGDKITELTAEITKLTAAIKKTNDEMDATSKARADENAETKTAIGHDRAALKVVKDAINAIQAFYDKNKIDQNLKLHQARDAAAQKAAPKMQPVVQQHLVSTPVQKPVQQPAQKTVQKPISLLTTKVSVQVEQKPDGGFKDGEAYGGKKGAADSVISMMDMVATDIQTEIDTQVADDKRAQEAFEKQISEMTNIRDTQEAKKIAAEKAKSDTEDKKSKAEQKKTDTETEKGENEKAETALKKNCEWVTENFDSRKSKREAEIESLIEAKGLLGIGGKGY